MTDKKSEKIPFLTKRKGKKSKRNVSVIQEEPKSRSGLGNNRENNRETGLSDDMNDLSEEVITFKLNHKAIRSRSHKPHLTFEIRLRFLKYSHFGTIMVLIIVRRPKSAEIFFLGKWVLQSSNVN